MINLVKIYVAPEKNICSGLLQRRVRIAVVDGHLENSLKAEAAIAMIDDPEIRGIQGLTIQHILDCANGGYGDVEECKKRLIAECSVCFVDFVRDHVCKSQHII